MQQTNLTELHQFIEQFNFATLISHNNGELDISYVPVTLNPHEGLHGTLSFHLGKQNPHSEKLHDNKNTVCIFHGPHAYISPRWYKSSPNVPTWNYAVVHAHGNPQQIHSEQLAEDLAQMVKQHEGDSNYIIPEDYQLKLMGRIIGFRMQITKIENIFKLGQNRSKADQDGMREGLYNQDNNIGLALAEFMKHKQEK